MKNIFRASLIISFFFGVNKLLALYRQYLVAKEFGFSAQIDAFNVANNMPDLIFSLFSGGALAMAFIPVFSEYIETEGRLLSWKLFSQIAIILFLATALVSIVIAIVAPMLVSSEIGIAPGFSREQQKLVVEILRIHLIATLIFSISGLLTASLQSHKHFFLPAISPIFYNLGIIIGAVFFSPLWRIHGLAYGVVLGSFLHLLVQVPGVIYYNFHFHFSIDLKDEGVRKVLKLMVPRVLTVLLIQIMFLMRDNFASRLEPGSITALTYGYFVMQVPETLIGTAVGTALLPTLSAHVIKGRRKDFAKALTISFRALISLSLISTMVISLVFPAILELIFDFSESQNSLLTLTTNAFMVGLLAHTLLEVCVRAFYAKHKAYIPLWATAVRTIIFILLGASLYRTTGAPGIAAIDSITVAVETVILIALLWSHLHDKKEIAKSTLRSILGAVLASAGVLAVFNIFTLPMLASIIFALIVSGIIYASFAFLELRLLLK